MFSWRSRCLLVARVRGAAAATDFKEAAILGWAGMRGVLSLAAALALPENFPDRDMLVFTTFVVICTTVVGQGLTLTFLSNALRLRVAPILQGAPLMTIMQARSFAFEASIRALEGRDNNYSETDDEILSRLIDETGSESIAMSVRITVSKLTCCVAAADYLSH